MGQAFSIQTWEEGEGNAQAPAAGADWWAPGTQEARPQTAAVDWDAYDDAMGLLDQIGETSSATTEATPAAATDAARFQFVMPTQEELTATHAVQQPAPIAQAPSMPEQYDWDAIQAETDSYAVKAAPTPDFSAGLSGAFPGTDRTIAQMPSAPDSDAMDRDLEAWAFGEDLSLDTLLGKAPTPTPVAAPQTQNAFTPDFSGTMDMDMAAWLPEPAQTQQPVAPQAPVQHNDFAPDFSAAMDADIAAWLPETERQPQAATVMTEGATMQAPATDNMFTPDFSAAMDADMAAWLPETEGQPQAAAEVPEDEVWQDAAEEDNMLAPDFSAAMDADMDAWMPEPEQALHALPPIAPEAAKRKEHVLAIVLIALACLALTIGIMAMAFGDGSQGSFFGLRFLTVSTDDMNPEQSLNAQYKGGFSQGDLLVIRKCETADLVALEDIVAIRNDNPDGTSFITQRFVRLEQTGDGTGPLIVTRADNAQTDSGPYSTEMLAGKKVLTIPKIGGLFAAIQQNFVVILIVLVCVAAAVVVGIYLYKKKEKQTQEDSSWETLAFPQA